MTRQRYLEPYRERAARQGVDWGVSLWANRQSQMRRFEVSVVMCDLTGKRVLDAGCSRGDFAAFLHEQAVAFDHYIGVDGLEDVIEFARGRDLPRCEFHAGDFVADPAVLSTGEPQVITLSGSLNTMTDREVKRALENCWAATRETLMFNFLSDRSARGAPPQTGPARRLGTMKLLDWAMTETTQVAFRQDYFPHGHDATIVMQKTKVGSRKV